MKKFLFSCASVALASSSVAALDHEQKCTTKVVNYQEEVSVQDPSYDNNDQWYVGFTGMLNKPLNTRIRETGFAMDVDHKTNVGFAMSVGKEMNANWRAEGELAYRRNGLSTSHVLSNSIYAPNGTSSDISGRVDAWSLMGNIYRDFKTAEDAEFYLGAGLGIARIGYRNVAVGGQQFMHDYDDTVAGQLIAGFNKHIDENASLDLSYRYFVTARNEMEMAKGLASDPLYRAHTFALTLRYTFGDRKTTPAPRTVMEPRERTEENCVPVAHPPVVKEPDPFLVLFNHDSAELTADAKAIIANAVEAFNEFGLASINVVGHTDRSGASSYNDKLASKRALAVKTERARLGISMSAIATESKGEGTPLVATGDGVREPQNRRAEIVLKK